MRILKSVSALALTAVVLTACTSAAPAGTVPPVAVTTPVPTAVATPTLVPTVAPTANPCAPASLATKTAGTLTLGSDNPAYPPYFQPSATNTAPWELGDPTNQQGFEAAVAYAVAGELGFTPDKVVWAVTKFDNAIQPGPKDFDVYFQEVSYTAERAQALDLTDGYYDVAQAVVAIKGSPIASVTTIAGLKAFKLGAQQGTTSFDTITSVVGQTDAAKTRNYSSNDKAVTALGNSQIDGLVVDLPTAFYVTAAQITDGVIVGQFPAKTGGEHFSAVLDKGSPLTACVNAAIGSLKASGKLAAITQEWLADKASAPVFQP
jgi:polar amino acid transport system substrate-binding protein